MDLLLCLANIAFYTDIPPYWIKNLPQYAPLKDYGKLFFILAYAYSSYSLQAKKN